MNLKQALLACFEIDQLKQVCSDLEVDGDRRSRDAMVQALSKSKRAKPELLIEYMTANGLREALELLGEPTGGKKDELVARLLAVGGRSAGEFMADDGRVADYLAPWRNHAYASQG